ncbi:MAG: DNA-formamidopyrimidine glycosylase, partial [Candidatus Omnitrophica bacterium]|nr:DNA-formamidopyrimidine glycosylase [Candidatus Omnitrophota bacterium]
MPELPEVETIVRDLRKSLHGKVFSDVIVLDEFLLCQKTEDFARRLKDQAVDKITRRGKAVIAHLASGEILVIQPMMTGQLIVEGKEDKHTRIKFIFSDGSWLLYNDQRRFGQLRVVEKLNDIRHFNILGPEPFSKDFTTSYIHKAFQKTSRPVKNVLLDHTFVAGIGNIYACEILYRSRLSPRRQACRISLAETRILYGLIREVLREAIFYRGSSMRNYRDGS